MLAGQVLDGTSRRAPAAFIQVAEFGTAGAAPIEVPADNQGYFTIQGLQVGRRYVLTARARNGSHELAGKTSATAPDPKVVIRLSEDYQPPPPRDVKADTAPPGGQADTRAPATGRIDTSPFESVGLS